MTIKYLKQNKMKTTGNTVSISGESAGIGLAHPLK